MLQIHVMVILHQSPQFLTNHLQYIRSQFHHQLLIGINISVSDDHPVVDLQLPQ